MTQVSAQGSTPALSARRAAIQLWNLPSRHCQLLLLCLPSTHLLKDSQLTPQSSTQDLRVEFLLVFTDFWAVTLWADIGWIDIDNGALPCIFPPDRLRFGTGCWNERHSNCGKCECLATAHIWTTLFVVEWKKPRGVRKHSESFV